MAGKYSFLAWILVLAAAARLLAVVLHAPVVGYANQYDMARTSACVDVWPDVDAPAAATPAGPLRTYATKDLGDEACYASTETILVGGVALLTLGLGGFEHIDIRWIGLSKAIVLILALAWVQWQLRDRPVARWVHALLALSLIADPINTLFLNTLYTEFGALLGLYLALSGFYLCLSRAGQTRVPCILVGTLGLLVLLFSRMQHLPLPWLIAVLAMPWLSGRERVSVAAVLVMATAIQVHSLGSVDQGISRANTYNTLVQTVLPADPETSFSHFQLPPACRSLLGSSWYANPFSVDREQCVGLYATSHADVAAYVLGNPAVAWSVARRAAFVGSSPRVPAIGEVEGGNYARVDGSDGIAFASISALLGGMGYRTYVFVVFGPLLLVFLMAVLALIRAATSKGWQEPSWRQDRALLWLGLCASTCAGLIFLSSVFGDGYSDLSKHLNLFFNLAFLAWVIALGLVAPSTRAGAGSGVAKAVFIVVPAAVAAVGVLAAFVWQPVFIGTVETVEQWVDDEGMRVRLSGWVKGSEAVTEVRVQYATSIMGSSTLRSAPDVDFMFPVAGSDTARRFAIEAPLPDTSGQVPIRFMAIDQVGATTVFLETWQDHGSH